mgnify:CR=1 FL=1
MKLRPREQEVEFKTVQGNTLRVFVTGCDTVTVIKQKLYEKLSSSKSPMKLLYKGQLLQDGQTLNMIGYKQDQVLVCMCAGVPVTN